MKPALLLLSLALVGCATTGQAPENAPLLRGGAVGPAVLFRQAPAPVRIQKLEGPATLAVNEVGYFAAFVNLERIAVPFRCRWHFGDGNTARSLNARHRYDRPGTYRVRFSIANATGTATDSLLVRVTMPPPG